MSGRVLEAEILKIKRESDRALLFVDRKDRYYLIAEPDEKVKDGDTVQYESCGVNFGWFLRVKKEVKQK